MLLDLFLTFFKIGLVSFGGGYAMLPLIDHEVTAQGWMTSGQLLDIIVVAGMSPGPIATNSAIMIGYNVAGIGGAAAAILGMVLPSLLIILLVAVFFFRLQEYPVVKSAFYGLRPVITGLIFYAAILFAMRNGMIGGEQGIQPFYLLIFTTALSLFFFTRIHPVFVLIASGITGMILFT
ncbi:chromate transporter [Effusibacillus consociatus]|uniref:Chromate transporter n=1 Tax=Effusibacillus consociatus TaxID=1117041 RepID=A0ABV9Q6F3_9BACL